MKNAKYYTVKSLVVFSPGGESMPGIYPGISGRMRVKRIINQGFLYLNVFAFLIFVSTETRAQTEISSFTLTNVVDGKMISLGQYPNAAVIIFTSNECPFDNYYKDRFKEMISGYAGKIQFLLVNSYTEPEESAEKMAIHYTDVTVPYLADKDQVAMLALGAKKSPEAFLLKNVGGKFTVVYSGAIDDNPQVPKDVNQHYLKDAIEKYLAGQKIEIANNRAVGCTMKRK